MTNTALILADNTPQRKLTKTVRFQDHGQDFLEWDIENGKVIGCRPFQASIWVGCAVQNTKVRKGDFLRIRTKSDRLQMTLKYPIEKVIPLSQSYVLNRRKLAMTPGSEWVFFRDGDDDLSDPWAGLDIRMVETRIDANGAMVLIAELSSPKTHTKRRPVAYSELW